MADNSTTASPVNLLQLEPIDNAPGTGWLYLVYDKKDYRISVARLFQAIDKAAIGLDKVDNTADVDKPISNLMAQALAGKVSNEAFEAFAQSVYENFKTSEEVDQIVAEINLRIDGITGGESLETLLEPIRSSLLNHQQRIVALEEAGFVTENSVSQALQQALNSMGTLIDQKLGEFEENLMDDLNNRFLQLESRIEENQASVVLGEVKW